MHVGKKEALKKQKEVDVVQSGAHIYAALTGYALAGWPKEKVLAKLKGMLKVYKPSKRLVPLYPVRKIISF